MKHIDELKDMLCEELDKIAGKGDLSAGDLDAVDKLTHSIKSLATIEAMGGYSQEDGYSMRGNSYARNGSRGTYRGSYGNSYRGYSRDGGKEEMVEHLEDMLEDAPDNKTKRAIKEALRQIEA